jgi:hypothetical protein
VRKWFLRNDIGNRATRAGVLNVLIQQIRRWNERPTIALGRQGRLTAAAAGLVVFLDNGAEELAPLADELENAWAAYISAQENYGVEVADKLVHKGVAHTLHRFEEAFTDARDKLASVIDLSEV